MSADDAKKEEKPAFNPEEKTVWPPIELEKPLGEDDAAKEDEVVIVACDGKTRFAVNSKAFMFYSKFAAGIMSGEIEGDIPLDSDRAKPEVLQKFVSWLKRHETVKRSKQPVPMPTLWTIDQYYSDKWDIAFIRQHFVGEDEDMTKHDSLMQLALLSTYLQCDPLTQMICTFFGWHIKKAAALDDPIAEVAKWNNRGPYTVDEAKTAMDWVRGALKGLEPGERTSMQSDDEFSAPPNA